MNKENYGIFLIVLGNLLYLSYIFFSSKVSSNFGDFSSGVLLGLSIATNLLGINATVRSMSKKEK